MSQEIELDFSSDETARETMKTYIRENFSDLLGEKLKLLDAPNGLELLHQEVRKMVEEKGISAEEIFKVA